MTLHDTTLSIVSSGFAGEADETDLLFCIRKFPKGINAPTNLATSQKRNSYNFQEK